MTTITNEPKILVKYVSCVCTCKLDSRACNSMREWNNETCQPKFKIYQMYKKDQSWNLNICSSEKGLRIIEKLFVMKLQM